MRAQLLPGAVVKAVGDLWPLAMRAGDSRDSAGWRRPLKTRASAAGDSLTRRQGDGRSSGRRGARVVRRACALACVSRRALVRRTALGQGTGRLSVVVSSARFAM
jgi:hypothetical protein